MWVIYVFQVCARRMRRQLDQVSYQATDVEERSQVGAALNVRHFLFDLRSVLGKESKSVRQI